MSDERTPETIPANPETAAFWEATSRGVLSYGWCDACGRAHFYPRRRCPHCFAPGATLRPASGRGVVYSFSVMRRAAQPYVIAYVTLEEGVTMMTNIVGCAPEEVRVGMDVTVTFRPSADGAAVPMFTPA